MLLAYITYIKWHQPAAREREALDAYFKAEGIKITETVEHPSEDLIKTTRSVTIPSHLLLPRSTNRPTSNQTLEQNIQAITQRNIRTIITNSIYSLSDLPSPIKEKVFRYFDLGKAIDKAITAQFFILVALPVL